MRSMTLSQAATVTGGSLKGADRSFTRVSTDSRSLQGEALFIALRGERFDGHDYLEQARDSGATALMVEQPSTAGVVALLDSQPQ